MSVKENKNAEKEGNTTTIIIMILKNKKTSKIVQELPEWSLCIVPGLQLAEDLR